MSPDALIDEMSEVDLRELCEHYDCALSELDNRGIEPIREAVRYYYEHDLIPAHAIRAISQENAKAIKAAADRIIRDNVRDLARLHSENQELKLQKAYLEGLVRALGAFVPTNAGCQQEGITPNDGGV